MHEGPNNPDHSPDFNQELPKDLQPPALLGSATWESKTPHLFQKDFFQLQYDFCKALAEKTGNNLFQVIATHSLTLRKNAFQNSAARVSRTLLPEITNENIVEVAYKNYLEKSWPEPALYHPKHTHRFGCFSYDSEKNPEKISLHFGNNEFDMTGPLDKSRIESRKKEIYDLLQDIKTIYPEAQTIKGNSWLYNIEAYRRLFPASYTKNMYLASNESLWATTAIWGQFFDSEYRLRENLTEELIHRVKTLPEGVPLSEIFKNGSNILPPLETEGPIADFYAMYGIEAPQRSPT